MPELTCALVDEIVSATEAVGVRDIQAVLDGNGYHVDADNLLQLTGGGFFDYAAQLLFKLLPLTPISCGYPTWPRFTRKRFLANRVISHSERFVNA